MVKSKRNQRFTYLNEKEWTSTTKAAEIEGEKPSEYIRVATKQRNEKVFAKDDVKTV